MLIRLRYSLPGDQCGQYGGITQPSNPLKCCSTACGSYCGASNCDEGPGGATACCSSSIDLLVCGFGCGEWGCGVAPCQIQGIKSHYINIVFFCKYKINIL